PPRHSTPLPGAGATGVEEPGNIQLTASGSVQANAPLKPTVNGKLSAVNMDKRQVQQTMTGGMVSTVAPAQ
ncbi:AsmA family protein, partial [Enterobacter hormaechei]